MSRRAPCRARRRAAVAALALGAVAPLGAQATRTDSALAYLDSVAAIVGRTHWDTAVVGAAWRARHAALRDSLRADPSVAATRRAASRLLQSLDASHFSIIAAPGPGEAFEGGEGTIRATVRVFWPYALVTDVPPATAAFRAGLRAGMLIEAVRGVPTARLLAPLEALPVRQRDTWGPGLVERAVAGEPGTPLRVGVRDIDGRVRELYVPRERPEGELLAMPGLPPQRARFEAWRLRHDGFVIGAIRFSPWLPQLLARVDSAVDRFRDADAIVIDLRGNPGGTALMATGVAGHFVADTLVLATMRARGTQLRYKVNPRRASTDHRPVTPFAGPLVLVTDAGSASTTELFAGGLQTAGRAIVVGDTTAGMALPAVVDPLPGGDRLLHAIADLRRPDGRPFEGRGVIPDYVVPLDRRRLAMGQDGEFVVAVAVAAARVRAARGLPPKRDDALFLPRPPAATPAVTPAGRSPSSAVRTP